MKRRICISAWLLGAALLLSACGVSKMKDITVTSVGVQYVVPTSARSMDTKLQVGIDNPAMAFVVQQITGTIRYQDKPLAHFVTGELELPAKSSQQYVLPCTVVLDDGASLLDILVVAAKRSMDGLKADVEIQAALTKNGVLRAPWTFKDLDLSQFSQ